jgi:hypothetical protein
MTRRTLDLIFSTGGAVLALLALVLGLVLQNQANFAHDYVTDQLSAQQIVFTPADRLNEEERQADCLVKYAGKPLTTGSQAECYANEYIGLHLSETNDGKTYAQTSTEARAATAEAERAAEANAPNAAELEAQADELNAKVQTLFRGETLRGLLLTSFGFSIFGERAQQAAIVAFVVAFVLALASIAGYIHAFTRSKDEIVK